MTPIQPVRRDSKGAAVAALHACLIFLIRSQSGLSANERHTLEQGLAAELRDQVYGKWTAHLVSLWQEQLKDRFQLLVNGNVDQATAGALNTLLIEYGAPADDPPPIKVTPNVTPVQPVSPKGKGPAVAALHACLLFLIRNQSGISPGDRHALEQGLAAELRDQVYGKWTAHLVSLWQQQLTDRFQLLVNGNVDQATAGALNIILTELGALTDGRPPVKVTPVQPVGLNDKGAAVAALHACLLFLIRNQVGISAIVRSALEQGLASELRDQAYGNWTAHLVSLWQEQLKDSFQLLVNGNVDQATAGALNIILTELGALTDGRPPVKITPFVNAYEFDGASRFRKIIPLPRAAAALPRAAAPLTGAAGVVLPGAYLALGSRGNSGLVTMIAENGSVLWSRQYSLSGRTLSFRDGVVAEAGFVLLCGLDMPTENRQAHVVVRIDQFGNLKWARQIRTEYTRFAERVLRQVVLRPNSVLFAEEFLLIGSANEVPRPTWDAIELIRLTADGIVLQSAYLKLGGIDDQFGDAIPFGDGYILVGDCEPAYAGFLVYIGTELNLLGSWLLSGPGRGLVLPGAVLALPNRLVLAGRSSGSSMIAEIALASGRAGSIVPTLTKASTFSVTDGQDQPTHIAAIGSDILVFNQSIAFARPQTVLRFDAALAAQAHYGFDFPGGVELSSLEIRGNDTVLIAGVDKSDPPQDRALLIATGPSLDCCKTKLLATPALNRLPVTLQATDATVTDRPATNEPAAIVVTDSAPKVRSLCGQAIETQREQLVQSPYLALQSAGSAGTDATRGILLRWHLMGVLESHLPKGTHAHTTVNFNKPDDFVTIYRAPWPGNVVPARQLSFATDKPTYVDDANSLLAFETGTATPRDVFHVRFLNPTGYQNARNAANPAQNMAAFLAAYGAGAIEVELRNRLAVACDLGLTAASTNYTVQVETYSVGENRPQAKTILTSRRTLGPADGTTPRLIAENMRSICLICSGAQINSIAFRCYDDVLAYLNREKQWISVGRFALTLDQATAYLRLEDPARTPVHGRWWKFNDGAFVNVNNYRSRWSSPNDGIAAAIQQYVTLSEHDPQAIADVAGDTSEQGKISISYLDLLQLAALDYHVARMFGLACIDTSVNEQTSYIHVAEYLTLGDLADGRGARPVQHLFMGLPTTLAQSRMPLVPDLYGVSYGLSVPTANNTPYPLTDNMGYTPDGLARYIRLYPECKYLYDADWNLTPFASSDIFDLAARTLPTLYGVENRKAGEAAWHKPEIAHEDVYADTAATPVAEAVPTPFSSKQGEPAFIHKETEPGIHEYAVYSINIFSRASTLSAVRATDATKFRKPNRLLPPSDLRMQLVQKEEPRVLTSKAEQLELDALLKSHVDPTLVRLTCNYAHVQEMNHDFADTIEILFRRTAPSNVTGGVKSVAATNDPSVIRIETELYTYLSTHETVQPVLQPAQKANFVGGVLVAGRGRCTITDISWPDPGTGENPVFLVRTNTSPGVTATDAGHALVIADVPHAIAPKDLFMAIENMAAAANWGAGNPLSATIRIGDASWQTRSEIFTRSDGTPVNRKLRGVWATAQVASVGNQYVITFDTYKLDAHPQASAADPVSWYKGIVRVPIAGLAADDRRPLAVLQIDQSSTGTLRLTAADDTGESGAVLLGAKNILVNYYPGYKIYLHADPVHGFDATAMLPAQGEGSRTTLIGARSVDNANLDELNQPYRSLPGVPQPLVAIETIEPEAPKKPTGLKYATPPDAYNKSSYTLTVTFKPGHKPFAAAFYRADAFSILRAIYKSETFDAVRAAIFPLEKDPLFADRFDDLFGFLSPDNTASALLSFAMPDGSSYALPNADAPSLALTAAMSLADRKAVIRVAMLEFFLPLTEQPLIYDLVRADPSYVPNNKKQTFRDENGDVLAPGVPPFDLAPMAKRFEAGGIHAIQFTDFTLDGSMNPNTVYFYFAREIGNRMQIGDPSPIFGPVKLVNLSPPSAPRLRKLLTVPYDKSTKRNPQVSFEVVAPSAVDPITRISIYRAGSALDALTLRTMAKAQEIDLGTLVLTAEGTFVLADDFANDLVIPYGEPLFYRLAWVRDVPYEDIQGVQKVASAISEPTKTLLANLIDVVNPTAPVPTLQLLSTTSSGKKLLRMSWGKTVHNGTYYASRLAPSGNWVRMGTVRTNDALVTFDLPDPLPVNDDEGRTIYYRFKTDVENSCGLLNLVSAPVTVSLDSL